MNTSNQSVTQLGKDTTYCDLLQLVVDDSGTSEQNKVFFEHMESCPECTSEYKNNLKIKELIKDKCSRVKAPEDLVTSIKRSITGL